MAQYKKSLLSKAIGFLANQRYPVTIGSNQNLKLFESYYNRYLPVFPMWDEKDYVREFTRNAGLYAIVTRICKTAATAPFKVYRIKDRKKFAKYKAWTGERATRESIQVAMMIKEQVFEEDNSHPLQALIDKPNSYQGGDQFTQNSIGFKLLTGNRFLFLKVLDMGANSGKPLEVCNLPPQWMTLIRGETLWDVAAYQLRMDKIIDIPKEFILHSKYWNPVFDQSGSHLWGLAPLKSATRNLTRTDSAEDRAVAMLQNAGAAGVMFNKGGEQLTPEQASMLTVKMNEDILGAGNAGKIALANGDFGYIPFGMTAVELSILEQEKYAQDQLCNIFHVPPGLFQSSANATDNNIKEWNKQLITQACIPAMGDLRDDWNEIAKLYKEDIYIDYDTSYFPELQEDQEKTARIHQIAYWSTPNEKRLAMNMDEDTDNPMMNEYLIPSGMQLLSDLDPANIDRQMDLVDIPVNGNGVKV